MSLLEMTSYHAGGAALEHGTFLEPGSAEWVVPLTPVDLHRKERMLAAYRSQRETLALLRAPAEHFRRAPPVDFSRPPHQGPLYYELQRWADGRSWRRSATSAIERHAGRACRL